MQSSDSIPVEGERLTALYQSKIPPALEGWTKDEKYELHLALKHSGYDMEVLQRRIPNKTQKQIKALIDHFKELLNKQADSKPLTTRQLKKIKKQSPQIPLSKWADKMTAMYDYTELQTESATALRIIADFEKLPEPAVCSSMDLRKVYHSIADAMEGKPLPNDPMVAAALNHCIMETNDISKGFISKSSLNDTLSRHGDYRITHPRPTKDGGLIALRHIALKTNYNPLAIPEDQLLHPSTYTNSHP